MIIKKNEQTNKKIKNKTFKIKKLKKKNPEKQTNKKK